MAVRTFSQSGHSQNSLEGFYYVPYAMTFVLVLIVVMATLSRPHVHPDEHAHLRAALYYKEHHLPPKVCAPETLNTYSVYGASRLNTHEIVYYLAGKFAVIMNLVPLDDYLRVRYFNVLLFVLLILIAHHRETFRILCVPVLISPQIWYVFSYFNSEAFAILSSLVVIYQVIDADSFFRRSLLEKRRVSAIGALLLAGVLFSSLLLAKKSFYFFVLFLILCGLAFSWNRGMRETLRSYGLRVALPVLVGIVIFGGWETLRAAVNEFELADKVAECREKTAREAYKPSTPLDKTHPSLYWKDKGIPLEDLFNSGWAGVVFRSAFGYYGYLEVPGSPLYYDLVRYLFIAFTGYLTFSVLVQGERIHRIFVVAAVLIFFVVFATTIWKSWTRDFQAQGRYYFSLLPVISFICCTCWKYYNRNVLSIFVIALFLLSVHSFLYVGIAEIIKVD